MHLSNAMKGLYLLVFSDEGREATRQNERWEYPCDRIVEGDYGCLQDRHNTRICMACCWRALISHDVSL